MLKRAHVGQQAGQQTAQETGAPETRLYRVVAERIEALIRSENLAAGTRLPPERELATRLGVSRASLREALIALELGGRVEVRGGSGIYIAASEVVQPEIKVAEIGPGPFEVLAARRLIEPEVCAMAARVHQNDAVAGFEDLDVSRCPPTVQGRRDTMLQDERRTATLDVIVNAHAIV